MELVENDSPGAGMSEKGIWQDQIWGRNRTRKEFVLEDPRAFKAWLVIYVARQGKAQLTWRGSLTSHGGKSFDEYCRPAFVRVIPRTNWLEKPFPRPFNHGMSQWPWNGYINWYDDRTPPKSSTRAILTVPTTCGPISIPFMSM